MKESYLSKEVKNYLEIIVQVCEAHRKFSHRRFEVLFNLEKTKTLIERAKEVPEELVNGITIFQKYLKDLETMVVPETLSETREMMEIQRCL